MNNQKEFIIESFRLEIASWRSVSSIPDIYNQLNYFLGILAGLFISGLIEKNGEEYIVLQRAILKRKDSLVAIRDAIKAKKIKQKDVSIDKIKDIESGRWVVCDHWGSAKSDAGSWESMFEHRDEVLFKPLEFSVDRRSSNA